MISPIERLPVEVFEIIALDLDLPAYQCLRLASHQLNLLSLSTFSKRFISHLTTTLGSLSLDRIVDISSHPYFCNVVTRLDIKLLAHRDYKLLTNIAKVGIFPPPKRFPVVSSVKQQHINGEATLYDDVLSPKYPNCIVERLTLALQGFGNLKAVHFRTQHNEPTGWHSIAIPDGDQALRAKCFQAVFDAIIKSEIQLEEFSMSKKKRATMMSKCAYLQYPTLQFLFSEQPSLRRFFARLQSLNLAIITSYNGDLRVPGWENGLTNFIMCAPNLKSLVLSLDRTKRVSHYSAAIVHSLALSCHFPSFERFHLINTSLHEANLTAFVSRHADSIQELILTDIRLLTGNWTSFWTSLKDIKGLRCLRLGFLEETKSPVLFRRRNKNKLNITLDVDKTGGSMCDMLDGLVTGSSDIQGNILSIDPSSFV